MDEIKEKKPEEKVAAAEKYPRQRNAVLVFQYTAFCFLFPAALLCVAFLCFSALVRDMKIGGLDFADSKWLLVVGLSVCFAGTVFFFRRAYRFGTFGAYFFAVNSRKFRNEMLRLLSEAASRYREFAEGKVHDAEKDILRYLQFSMSAMRGYRKYYQSNGSLTKLEAVTYNETLKMTAILDAAEPKEGDPFEKEFPFAEFLAAVKKVHFCIEERFAGVSARAYKGEGNFAFISYSHRNSKVVLEVIKRLQEAKLNVWFDEGITEGDDWMDHIAKKIDACSHFVMFQTPGYVKSINCNVEIKRALKTNRTIIRVILEESKMAEGVEMYLDAIQAIDCRAGVDESKLVKLIELLQPAKIEDKKQDMPEQKDESVKKRKAPNASAKTLK